MPTLKEFEKWKSTGQTAKALRLSRQTILNLANEKKIRGVRTAAGWLFDPKAVEKYAAERSRG